MVITEVLLKKWTLVESCRIEIPSVVTVEDERLAVVVPVAVASFRLQQRRDPGDPFAELVGAGMADHRSGLVLPEGVDEHAVTTVELEPECSVELVVGVGAHSRQQTRAAALAVHRGRFRYPEAFGDPVVHQPVEGTEVLRSMQGRGEDDPVADAFDAELLTFLVDRVQGETQSSVFACEVSHRGPL